MNRSNPYDAVLYRGYPFRQTHPDRLATVATLFAMTPVAIDSCRVLELGCGDGANLIPMAVHLPESEFVGIDSAACPIADGATLIRELALKNIVLYERNLLDVSAELGQFDYIIAHGIYSWVAPPVRDKILSICKTNLAPQGVAFISYNTYPGGHLRQMIRQMMLIHVRNITEPQERIDQARALLHFLSESQPVSDEYAMFVKKELDFALSRADEAVYHDDLAEINTPVYFSQFIEHAAGHGLQYLSEAYLPEAMMTGLNPNVTQMLKQDGLSVVAQEQYLDFVNCRKFRQTLLCHRDIVLDRSLKPERLRNLFLSSCARALSQKPDIVSKGLVEQFGVSNGGVISVDYPLAKAALLHLGEQWPSSEPFDHLVCTVYSLVGKDGNRVEGKPDEEIATLCEFLLAAYGADMVELQVQPPKYMTMASDRPMVSPLSRLQARQGGYLTSLRHTTIDVKDGLARRLIMSLDGTRDRMTLLRELTDAVRCGEINLESSESYQDTELSALSLSSDSLERKLSELARLALLVA